MGKIYDAMANFFKKDDWPATQVEGQTAMSMNFQGQNGRWGCLGRVDEEKQLVLFYSYCPIKAPEDKRPILADFLTRANYGLYVGNFEMDFNDGEVRGIRRASMLRATSLLRRLRPCVAQTAQITQPPMEPTAPR